MNTIWYLGSSSIDSTSFHRSEALKRLGYNVLLFDPYKTLNNPFDSFLNPIHFRTGYILTNNKLTRWCEELLENQPAPDIIWINSGELFCPSALKVLRQKKAPIILYNNDDPTGKRDGARFNSLLKSIPYYDVCAVMRDVNINEFKKKKAQKVVRVTMSYDEVEHAPFSDPLIILPKFHSDVAFIGTCMKNENRDQFIYSLIKSNINVSIWGDRWNQSPYWNKLKPYHRGNSISGREYVSAIQGAKICLGLLSKGNRDLHTQRSLEVPYAGGVLCAQRTNEHLELFREKQDALFWSSLDECTEICKYLLENNNYREEVRLSGMKRVREIKVGNQDICQKILSSI